MNVRTINDKIKSILDEAVYNGDELGAQVVVYLDGKIVVDCWSGYADPEKTRKVDENTIFPVFSSGKAVASTAVHRLVEKGIMDYDMKVADVWPEFASNGKEDTRLWHIMSHRSGVFECPVYNDASELADWDFMCSRIAEAVPAWAPGGKTRYQSVTYSWLLGELAHRADGRPFAQIVKEEVCDSAGIDSLYFGTDDNSEKRVAFLKRGSDMDDPIPGDKAIDMMMGYEAVRRACLPGFNCMTNARSLAKHYAAIMGEVDGVAPLLSSATLEKATTLNRASDDPIPIQVGTWELFGLGYVLCGPKENLGQIFGHGGLGGSEGLVDRSKNMIVAYTKNLMHGAQPTRDKIYEALDLKYRDWGN